LVAQEQDRQPNVVLITVDTLRADRLGCYGNDEIETPGVDSLAADGILFQRAIAQVPLTWPSHAAIFTGTYPFHNGVQDFTGQPLSEDFRTLAQSFKANGYATGAVVSSFVLDRSWGLGRGFDFYQDAFAGLAFAEKDIALVDRRAGESVDETLEWLKGVKSGPFFLWLHLFDPHSAYDPPEPFRSRYGRNLYDGEIAYADSQLVRLFAWLKQEELYDETMIVFTSDHGESLGEHGEDEHGFFVYNSTVHVPLIIKPQRSSPLKPRQVDPPVETISIGPTLLQMAGIQDAIHSQFQAGSLVALMSHGRAPEDRAAYAETFYPLASFGWSPLRSVQTAHYQYVEAPIPELYDLEADPKQSKNLFAVQAGRAETLRSKLDELTQRHPPPDLADAGQARSPEEIEKLRSLGYIAYRSPTGGEVDPATLADPKEKIRVFNNILEAGDLMRAGRYARARSLLKQIERTDSGLYLVPFMLGQVATRQRRWEEAAAGFERSLELNPEFDQAMMGLGRALSFLSQSDRAKSLLRRALALNPKNVSAYYELARVQAKEDLTASTRTLTQLLAIQPQFAPALRERGMMRIGLKQYSAASQDLQAAMELGLTDPATYNFLGIAYSNSGRFDEAIGSYESALAAKPDYAEAHLNLALAYQRKGEMEKARQAYETACRMERRLCQYVPD
jgi:arylsulfatase A-like enzyme/Flp pilus assembly protein TadD